MSKRIQSASGNARSNSILSAQYYSCLVLYVSYLPCNGEDRNTTGMMVRSPVFGVSYDRGAIPLISYRKDHCALCPRWSTRYCLCGRTGMARGECNDSTTNPQEAEHNLWCMVRILFGCIILHSYVQFRAPNFPFTPHMFHIAWVVCYERKY